MLEGLFGNKSAVKVMLAIFLYEEMHASAIAQLNNTAVDPIKKQLERFEESGFLISRNVGRSRLYKFNDSNPLINPLKQMLMIVMNSNEMTETTRT
jgi:predicted transcriptional regulator